MRPFLHNAAHTDLHVQKCTQGAGSRCKSAHLIGCAALEGVVVVIIHGVYYVLITVVCSCIGGLLWRLGADDLLQQQAQALVNNTKWHVTFTGNVCMHGCTVVSELRRCACVTSTPLLPSTVEKAQH